MTSAIAPHPKPRTRKPRAPDADVTLRIDPVEHQRLTLFVKALERHFFIESRRMERVSQSEAIKVLLDQEWAKRIMQDFEELAGKSRERDKL